MVNVRRTGWVDSVIVIHLLPGMLLMLVVTFLVFLGLLSFAIGGVLGEGKGGALIGLAFGGVALVPVAFSLPLFCVGLGILRRRAWARIVAIYLAAGLAGTGLLLSLVEANLFGLLPLAHASLTLGVLLTPRIAAEFGDVSRSRDASSGAPDGARGS